MVRCPTVTRTSLLLAAAATFGCADIIGLNRLGEDDGDGTTSGGASSNDETGGMSAGGSSDESGGEPGAGGTDGYGGEPSGGQANSGGSGESTGGGSGTGSGGQPFDCTDDEFDSASLTTSCWSVFNGNLSTAGSLGYAQSGGAISMVPVGGRGWVGEDTGFFMYQEVTGNFRMEVLAKIEIGTGQYDPPTVGQAFGGLLALRADVDLSEASGAEPAEYYAIKFGTFDDPSQLGYRAEYTIGGATTTEQASYPEIWKSTYLRLCRVDSVLWTAVKPDDASEWLPLHGDAPDNTFGYNTSTDGLPPLAPTLRVGPHRRGLGQRRSGRSSDHLR